MEEIKNEDGVTSENTNEESEDTTSTNEPESTDEGKDDIEAKNRQLYERTKKAEQKAKEEEAKRLMLEKKTKEATGEAPDAQQLAKTVVALKDYSTDELDYIFKQAKFLNVDPLDAARDDDVKLFLEAKRERKERELKTPEPSTKQSTSKKDVSQWTNEDLRNASENQDWEALDEFRKWAKRQS